MRIRRPIVFLALLLPGLAAGQGVKSTGRLLVPTPAPTPTPAGVTSRAASQSLAAAAVLETPEHTPQQLEFGDVWNGQSSRRTFGFITTAGGAVAAQIPAGPFRIVEFRIMSALKGAPESAMSRLAAAGRTVEFRQSYPAGQPAPAQWTVGANQVVELDVVFEPKFDLFTMTAGPKTGALKLSGPGPAHPWSLSVPMQAMFNGLHIEAIFTVDDHTVQVVEGTAHVDVGVKLVGVDSAVKGTVRGQSVPAGMTVGTAPIAVNPAQTVTAKVPVTFAWGSLKPDGISRDVTLALDAPGVTSTAAFSVVPVPGTVVLNGTRNGAECGIDWLSFDAIFFPEGRVVYNLSGQNQDLFQVRDVLTTLSVGGRAVAWGVIHLDLGAKTSTANAHWNSANLNADFDSRFSSADYVPAVRGGVAFSCRLVGTMFTPPF